MNLIFKYAKLNIHENFNIPHVLGLIYTHIHILVHILFRVSYRSPLSKQAQLSNNLSIAVFQAATHTRTYARIISLLSLLSWRNASHENLEIKQTTPDKRRAGTCYVHLVTCSGKLGAARLVPLSPPFPFPPHSPSPPSTLSFRVQLVSTTRSAEPPQTGTMSRYCDPLQAAESCISSSMFPLPVSLPILSIPVPLGRSCIDCVPRSAGALHPSPR